MLDRGLLKNVHVTVPVCMLVCVSVCVTVAVQGKLLTFFSELIYHCRTAQRPLCPQLRFYLTHFVTIALPAAISPRLPYAWRRRIWGALGLISGFFSCSSQFLE